MGQKIAVILMLVITVVLIVYLLALVITGGNKEKLNFKYKREQKRQKEIERGIVTREDKVREKEELKKRIILENVCESQMEIKAVFDQFKLSLQDIMQLQPDDIIPLNKPIDSDILLTVDKNPWYTAKLGETKQKKAVKLQNIIDKRDEGVKWEKNTTAK